MNKLFSSRIDPLDEWVLVRVASSTSPILTPQLRDGKIVGTKAVTLKEGMGQVVAVGPGSRSSTGSLVPVDPRITPGATVVFPGKSCFQAPDIQKEMEEEGLYFIPASMVVCVLKPAGMPAETSKRLATA